MSADDRILSIVWVFLTAINLILVFGEPPPFYRKHGFNGVTLKFGFYHVPPFHVVTFYPDGNFSYTGSSLLIHNWLQRRLDFSISYVLINESVPGGPAQLGLALLVQKELDALATGMIATPERIKKVDFAYMTWAEPYAIVVPQPGMEDRLVAFIRPFQPTVWLLTSVAIVFTVGFVILYEKFVSCRPTKTLSYDKSPLRRNTKDTEEGVGGIYLMYIINLLTNQGGKDPYSILSLRMLAGVWALVAMVLVNSYSGTVISYLTVTKMKPKINSFEDLAAQPQIKIIARSDAVIGQQILEAQSGVLKVLGDQARSNPDQITADIRKITKLLETGEYAFPFMLTFCKTFVATTFRKENNCRFTMSDPLPMVAYWSAALQKNSKYTWRVNNALVEIWETGLPVFWVKNSTPQAPQCFEKLRPLAASSRKAPLRLNDLTGAFLVLGVGIALAVLAFVIETIAFYCFHVRH